MPKLEVHNQKVTKRGRDCKTENIQDEGYIYIRKKYKKRSYFYPERILNIM